jgi:hypothetical protein
LTRLTHLPQALGIINDGAQAFGQGLSVAGLNNPASDAFANIFGQRAGSCYDDWLSKEVRGGNQGRLRGIVIRKYHQAASAE